MTGIQHAHSRPVQFLLRYKAWLYLLPALTVITVFQIYPICKSFLMGFYTDFDYLKDEVYAWGFDNFRNLMNDGDFALAIRNTVRLTLVAAPLSILTSLLFAVLLNSDIRCRKVFQSIYFLPFVTSMVAVSIVWAWMLNKDYGLINAILKIFGVKKIAWLTDPKMTLPILVVLCIWKGLGYRVIIFLAGLQGIDQRYYQAARLDGCSDLRYLFTVMVPMSRPTMVSIALLKIINSWNSYMWPLISTNSREMRTLPVGLAYFSTESGTDYNTLMAFSLMIIAPTVIVYLLTQKYIIQGVSKTGLKG